MHQTASHYVCIVGSTAVPEHVYLSITGMRIKAAINCLCWLKIRILVLCSESSLCNCRLNINTAGILKITLVSVSTNSLIKSLFFYDSGVGVCGPALSYEPEAYNCYFFFSRAIGGEGESCTFL